MPDLIWWGFGWQTPLRDIGWTWVILSWLVVVCIYLIVKLKRGW